MKNKTLTDYSASSRARFGSGVEKYFGRHRVADRPVRFPVKRLDLGVAGIFWIGFDDGVSPKTTVVRSFNVDGEGCIADVLAINLDSSASRLRNDLNFQPRSHGMRVRCASRADQKN